MPIAKEIQVINKLGLHARAAAKLVQTASGFGSEVQISYNGQTVNAKSIMGIMMLAASCGVTVEMLVEGSDESAAAKAIENLFEDRFGEEE